MVYQVRNHVRRTFEQLLKLLPESERTKPQVILVAGGVTSYRNDTDRELPFRQESNFFYLTGCDVVSSILLAKLPANGNPSTTPPTTTLFIPKAERADIMWSVPPPEVYNARKMLDASEIKHSFHLPDAINTTLKDTPDAIFHVLPRNSPLFPQLPELALSALSPNNATVEEQYLLPALQRTRLIKDSDEIALIKKANEISSRAHETVMRVLGLAVKNKIAREEGAGVTRPLLPGEWFIEKEAEAEAIFVASCRREGAPHQAYLPIVAASSRASTLHYCCNDKDFAWGPIGPRTHVNNRAFAPRSAHHHVSEPHTNQIHPQVLLIDAGCEFNYYASDITRTMPVGNGGRFVKETANIYDIVHEMQKAAFDMIKPGVHWDRVHLECHKVLIKNFLRLNLFKGTEEEILKSGVSAAFFPHGLGHSLGMDVHDVPEASRPEKNDTIPKTDAGSEKLYTYLRLRLPLEAGMVVTVEPGIYFHPHLVAPVLDSKYINLEGMKDYQFFGGLRIEDVIVITKDGYENLTTVKSDRSWVEDVCSGEL
ncbi:hypothetical protein D9756_009213 [Leucocoprinus leucothites]|uniref:Aminopeptidase P N-terminal domain-containing protein n=1 Tax=Leucocoprinus leucothites TaxID=201217 RepID=A0A8H5CZG6_9AGAR|nr:hypothetical protein D9756_009213 [Leucoagaricus leucothites]